jgi:hypothetical protein
MTREQALDLLPCLVCRDLAPETAESLRVLLQADPELREVVLALEESQESCLERLERRASKAAMWPEEAREAGQGKPRSLLKVLALGSFVLLVLMWGGATLLQALL